MIDINKKYCTRDGRDVRLLCTDGPGESHPVIGIIDNDLVYFWKLNGMYANKELGMDLIEVPNTVTKTFYRRKWFLHHAQGYVGTEYNYSASKEAFDYDYGVMDHSGTWSDEWETITIEVPV